MRRSVIISACAAVATFLFTGCGDECPSDPFEGTDNHLTTLSVTAAGQTYTAAIAGDRITLTVPVGVSLAGARPEYSLSERATILPDPAEITDWSGDQVFRVRSYSGVSRDYTYTVVRAGIPYEGNVQLFTRADVDAFAETGATVVEGNLIIGSPAAPDPETAITSLERLSALREVRYHIIINAGFSGTSLEGLDNIEKCGGLYMGSVSSQIAFPAEEGVSASLPALKAAGDVIINSNSVKSVSFPELVSAGAVFVSSNSLTVLELPALEEVAGDMSLRNASGSVNSVLTDLSFPALESIGGSLAMQYFSGIGTAVFPKLSYIGGGMDVALNSTALEEFNLPRLETINGAVNIERAPGLLKISLPKIKSVSSFIYNKTSYGNYPLTGLDLSSLETVANEFYIRGIPMESLDLPKLKNVGGDMTVWDLKSMETFNMPEIAGIGGKLHLYYANLLGSLDLSGVTAIGDLSLTGCLSLGTVKTPAAAGNITVNCASNADCPIPVFEGLQTVTGTMSFTSCGNTPLFRIPNVKTIGTFTLGDGAQGSELDMPDVEEINSMTISSYKLAGLDMPRLAGVGTLAFSNIWSLTTINIPELRTVGAFSLSEHGSYNTANARMTDLDAFSGITSMGSVAISYCGKLADFSGLAAVIPGLDDGKWSVAGCAYNPTYPDMEEGRYTKD